MYLLFKMLLLEPRKQFIFLKCFKHTNSSLVMLALSSNQGDLRILGLEDQTPGLEKTLETK